MNMQKISLLQELAIRAGPLPVWVANAIQSLSVRYNEQLYQKVLQVFMANPQLLEAALSPFTLPQDQLDIPGELDLGTIKNTYEIRLRIPKEKLPMHVCVAGSSGSGKSNFSMLLAEQAARNNVSSIKLIDPKADEYKQLAEKHPEFIMLKWNDLRFNMLDPPPNVPRNEWNQTLVGHLSQTFSFWVGAEALLIKHLTDPNIQTLPALLSSIIKTKASFGSKDLMIKSTVVSRLQLMLDLFGPTITSPSGMLEQLSNSKIIISMTGLMAESESWLTEYLLIWEFYYRVYNLDKRQLTLHIYDECQHRLFSNAKEHAANRSSSSQISKLVDEARAMNIGICSLSQEPSTLIKAITNNSWLKIVFHLGSGSEIRVMKDALGLQAEEADTLHYLETGEAIVRMAGGYMHALPVIIDEFKPDSVLSTESFTIHQETLKRLLYKRSEIQEPKSTQEEMSVRVEKPKTKPKPTNKPDDAVKPLLSIWLNLEAPFLTQGELFKKAGITSGSKQSKLKKLCIRDSLIKEHKIQTGKTHAVVWEPTEKAYKHIQREKPKHKSKGGYFHQFIAHRIKEWAQVQGYEADIEYQLQSGKQVDLTLRKQDELIFLEIAISPPLEKELSNYEQDLNSHPKPTQLIAVAQHSRARKELEQLIQEDLHLRNKVEVRLAGEFLNPKKP